MGGGVSPAAHRRTRIFAASFRRFIDHPLILMPSFRRSRVWRWVGVELRVGLSAGLSVGLVVWLVVGCAPSGGSPGGGAAPEPGTAAAVSNPLIEPWNVERKYAKVSHIFRVDAVLVSRIESTSETDTVSAQASVTWEPTRDGQWVGAITDYLVGSDSIRRPAGLSFPVAVVLTRPSQPGQVPRFVVPADGSCAPVAAIAQVLREGIVTTPRTLRRDQTWSDSSVTTVCRDSIPLTVTTVRRYKVVGAELRDGEVVVLVDRVSTVAMRGEGRQLGAPVQLVADGTGAMRLAITLDDGILASAEGTNDLVLRLTGRRRSQELRQRSTVRIVRR